jgi:hypothetical protein
MTTGVNGASGSPLSAWLSQEFALQVLRDVVARCRRAGVPVLPVKGVVTARVLYDDVAQRPISDLDIRIRPRDFWRWRQIADGAGWRCWNAVWTYRVRNYTISSLPLDVETRVGPPGMCGLSVDDMLARAEELQVAPDLRIRIPEVHDHTILLAVNAYKDWFLLGNRWSRTDLDRIVRTPEFRPATFLERAVGSGIHTIAWIVADWMSATYENEVWGVIRDALDEQFVINRRAIDLYRRVASTNVIRTIPAPLFHVFGIDGVAQRARSIATTVAWLAERWVRGRTHLRSWG